MEPERRGEVACRRGGLRLATSHQRPAEFGAAAEQMDAAGRARIALDQPGLSPGVNDGVAGDLAIAGEDGEGLGHGAQPRGHLRRQGPEDIAGAAGQPPVRAVDAEGGDPALMADRVEADLLADDPALGDPRRFRRGRDSGQPVGCRCNHGAASEARPDRLEHMVDRVAGEGFERRPVRECCGFRDRQAEPTAQGGEPVLGMQGRQPVRRRGEHPVGEAAGLRKSGEVEHLLAGRDDAYGIEPVDQAADVTREVGGAVYRRGMAMHRSGGPGQS